MKIYDGDLFNINNITFNRASAKCYNLYPKFLQTFQPDDKYMSGPLFKKRSGVT